MPSTPTVSMCPQNISDLPGALPSSTPMTFGRPGAASCIVDVETDLPHVRSDRAGDRPFACCARHERRVDGRNRHEIVEEREARIHGSR